MLAFQQIVIFAVPLTRKTMHNSELELWWSSLAISQKERIARKGLKKASPNGHIDEEQVRYPACTVWWNALPEEQQQKIHDHCTNRHGYILPDWNDADPYGD